MNISEIKEKYALDAVSHSKKHVYKFTLVGPGGVIGSKKVSLDNLPKDMPNDELIKLVRSISSGEWFFGSFNSRGGSDFTFNSKAYNEKPGVKKTARVV